MRGVVQISGHIGLCQRICHYARGVRDRLSRFGRAGQLQELERGTRIRRAFRLSAGLDEDRLFSLQRTDDDPLTVDGGMRDWGGEIGEQRIEQDAANQRPCNPSGLSFGENHVSCCPDDERSRTPYVFSLNEERLEIQLIY